MEVNNLFSNDCIVGLSDLELDVVWLVNVVSAAVAINPFIRQHNAGVLVGIIDNRHQVLGEFAFDLKIEFVIDFSVEDLNTVTKGAAWHAGKTLQQKVDLLQR